MVTNRENWTRDKQLFLWFIFLLLPLFIVKSLDFPVNVDEILHYTHARTVIDWYVSGGEDKTCLDTPWSNLKYYGQSVDNLSALLNRWIQPVDEYKLRHIIGAVFGWLLILFTSLTAREITGKYRTGITGAILMLLIPPVMGQYCNNLKDIPFAAGYAFSLYSMILCFKRLPGIPWKYIILMGLAVAFLISVRVGGLIILAYLFFFLFIWFTLKAEYNILSGDKRKNLYRLLIQLIVIGMIGYFAGLAFWPYGLIDPLSHPLESLSLMEHYSISIRQLFQGEWYWSTSLPGSFLFISMLISLPELLLTGLVLYLVTLFSRQTRPSVYDFFILFTLLFPFFYVIIIKSNLYSSWRQMYFLAVPLVILSALGIERMAVLLKNRRTVLVSFYSILVLAAVPPIIHYFKNSDTAYVYFNTVSGGNKKAWSNFEYDYYWHGMKEAAEWFDDNINNDGVHKVVASNFDLSVYLQHRPDITTRYIHFDHRSWEEWDYGIFGLNYIHPYQLKNDTWQPANIQNITSDSNNPLAVISKRSNDNDFEGVRLAKLDNHQEAIPLLEKAASADPNNFILYEYLAESYYHLDSINDCIRTIRTGKKRHPWSEKLRMIDAQLEYDKGDYEIALKKCIEIVNINDKYFNIVPLLIACYEKTGDMDMAQKLKSKYLNHEN